MTPEEYQWNVNLVKDRHESLNLTFEQAEQIYKYEQDKDNYSQKHYFSVWEEWDYEATVFRQILDPEQFKVYKEKLAQQIGWYSQSLIEQDLKKKKEIDYYQDLLTYYENVFLPDLLKDPFIFPFVAIHPESPKIEFLRSEYKIFLNDRKKELLAGHFRHNRLLAPNELQAALLKHKISDLWPNYSGFKHLADDAVKTIIEYLKTKIKRVPAQTNELLTNKLNELDNFNSDNHKKYYGERKGGWHIVIRQLSDEEEQEQRLMILLLLDKEKYGS